MGKVGTGCNEESCDDNDARVMRCDLCETEFRCDDPQLDERIERHRGYHRPRTAKNAVIGECGFDVVGV